MPKQALINHVKSEKSDIFQTPPEAILPILKYIPNNVKTIWECCDPGWSIITYILKQVGYNVISTDKETGFDFLKDKPNFEFDMILTNPPFSLKTKFIKKCYEYKKPFALLVPMTTLEGKERFEMYKKYGINIVVLDQRVNYVRNRRGSWFASIWIFWDGEGVTNNNIYFEKMLNVKNENFNILIDKYMLFKEQYKNNRIIQRTLF